VDTVRVLGLIASENKFVSVGTHQSLNIHGPMKITLIKNHFDSIHVKKLKEAAGDAQ